MRSLPPPPLWAVALSVALLVGAGSPSFAELITNTEQADASGSLAGSPSLMPLMLTMHMTQPTFVCSELYRGPAACPSPNTPPIWELRR